MTEWSLDLLYLVGGYWYCVLAAEMLDHPGRIIARYQQTIYSTGVILEFNPGTGAYDFVVTYNPGVVNFPYGLRVPPDH